MENTVCINTSQGVFLMPFLIRYAAALISSNVTVIGSWHSPVKLSFRINGFVLFSNGLISSSPESAFSVELVTAAMTFVPMFLSCIHGKKSHENVHLYSNIACKVYKMLKTKVYTFHSLKSTNKTNSNPPGTDIQIFCDFIDLANDFFLCCQLIILISKIRYLSLSNFITFTLLEFPDGISS